MLAKEIQCSINMLLEAHGLPLDSPYVVLAGSAMYFYGMRATVRDIDIYVPDLPVDHDEKFYGKLEIDAKPHWNMWSSEELLRDSIVIHGVRVMDLKSILRMKKMMNRSKDQTDIKLLEARIGERVSHRTEIVYKWANENKETSESK